MKYYATERHNCLLAQGSSCRKNEQSVESNGAPAAGSGGGVGGGGAD